MEWNKDKKIDVLNKFRLRQYRTSNIESRKAFNTTNATLAKPSEFVIGVEACAVASPDGFTSNVVCA